jgi:hypothetical protein
MLRAEGNPETHERATESQKNRRFLVAMQVAKIYDASNSQMWFGRSTLAEPHYFF